MAVERSVSFPTLALALTVLFLVQSFAPLATHPFPVEDLQEEVQVMPTSAHVPFSSGYGHDFAGELISFDGLEQAEVRQESGLNIWTESTLHLFENSTPGTPDLVLNGREKMNLCWSTVEGEVHYASRTFTGSWTDAIVDTVAPSTEETLVDCALAINENGRPYLMYADGADIKVARIAYSGQVYFETTWLTRTIVEDVSPTDFRLGLRQTELEWGVFRDSNGSLWQLNFSGTRWSHALLDLGPVGHDIELAIDDNEIAHVAYAVPAAKEVRLIRVDGSSYDHRVLSRDDQLGSHLGMGLDGNALEQVVTSTTDPLGQVTLYLLRSLSGQETGRINPAPSTNITGAQNSDEGAIVMADINGDGFDDILIAEPQYDGNATNTGRVLVHYGSTTGVSIESQDGLVPPPDLILQGELENELFGHGLGVGDFNGDGYYDAAIGAPGWNDTSIDFTGSPGRIQVYLGNSSGLETNAWWNATGEDDEQLGWDLSVSESMDGDAMADLVVSARGFSEQVTDVNINKGKLLIFNGSTSGLEHLRNITQTKNGPMFGQNFASNGDLNGDGMSDLLVSNTGDLQSPLGLSSIEIFFGGLNGYNGTLDQSIVSNLQGKLFGSSINYIGDVNSDGFDDFMFSEPFNGSIYRSGKIWAYYGSATGIASDVPSYTLQSVEANALLGRTIMPAGDVNEDGYDDVLIMQASPGNSGKVELILGSSIGLRSDWELLATGQAGENIGMLAATHGDIDGDGLSEIILSRRDISTDTSTDPPTDLTTLMYQIHSERDWESTSFSYSGNLTQLDLSTSARGETSMFLTFQNNASYYSEHVNDATPAGVWKTSQVVESSNQSQRYAFTVTESGRPIILEADAQDGLIHRSIIGHTAVEQTLVTTGQFGEHLGSNLDVLGQQRLAYASAGTNQLFTSIETESGWATSMVRSSISLEGPVSVMTQGLASNNNETVLIYRDAPNNVLEMARQTTGSSTWTFDNLSSIGSVVSQQQSAAYLADGSLAVLLVMNDGTSSNLSLWVMNGSNVDVHTITSLSDLSSNLRLAIGPNGSIMAAVLTTTGALSVHELSQNATTWTSYSAQIAGTTSQFNLDLVGGQHPMLAVHSDVDSTPFLHTRLNETMWSSLSVSRPDSNLEGAWDLVVMDDHYLLLTSSGLGNELTWNSISKQEATQSNGLWSSLSFGYLAAGSQTGAQTDGNGTVHLAWWDNILDDVGVLRLYLDTDRDLIFDLVDDLPLLGNQWADSDGDNFGDNAAGPMADACVNDASSSSFYVYGCSDYDADGYADTVDGCQSDVGSSWLGRLGCRDDDQDGWSDNDATYFSGDAFVLNWKQSKDSDGDGYGDNSGPDCCATLLDPNNPKGDLFPFNPSQYADYDGDGWGDNESDTVTGDACPWNWGASWRDRNGCLDSDTDGSSDPSGEGTFLEWNVTLGADIWPFDSTQWTDSDGDGYGDNSSDSATNPDKFPDNIAAAEDNDSDGYPDVWTSFYNRSDEDLTNNGAGLVLDGCPGTWGNSTNPVSGCPDTDGDGWDDSADAFPLESTQWLDFDSDGFGDNPDGYQADECPSVSGVLQGTVPIDGETGIGCRFIDDSDDDGDYVSNEEDTCPDTDSGLSVNAAGCADNQLDDDQDGVTNDLDQCEQTEYQDTVDTAGCSQAQRQTDTDGDGVFDPVDLCPFTAETLVDSDGCSANQIDTDQDGIVDANDLCPATPEGFPVDSDGCTDETALEQDLDGDGYQGVYVYTLNSSNGLRENQSGDAFPTDASQWFDQDGDGYGDNIEGLNADQCPLENGTSYIDFIGCYDDGDGYRDLFEPQNLAGNPTQWEDRDRDGYGDNASGTEADLCPDTEPAYKTYVDSTGCDPTQSDGDGDGTADYYDNCPEQPAGNDGGYGDGCPITATSDEDTTAGLFGLSTGMLVVVGLGGLVGTVLLIVFILRMFRSDEFDYDDDEDDDDDWDDDEDSVASSFGSTSSTPQRNAPRSTPTPAPTPTPSVRSPPTNTGGPPNSGPPGRSPSGGPPQSKAPSGPPRGGKTTGKSPVSKIPVVEEEEEEGTAKVRKARIKVDLSIFDDWQTEDRESAADWVRTAIDDGEKERTVLMQLQETGWSAPQSRAIFDLGRNR